MTTNPKQLTDSEVWPNCSVPDCEYKVWCAGGSDKCYAHTHGLLVIPFDEYMKLPPID